MGRKHSTKELVTEITSGIFSTVTDMVLATVYSLAEYSQPRSQWKNIDFNVTRGLEKFSSQTITRAFRHLHQNGYIETTKTPDDELPMITHEGIEKILKLIPVYKSHRSWGKHFYLISYDLPMVRNSDQNHLRYIIKLLGCVRLQQSVWLTPYHPKKFLSDVIDDKNLNSIIAISRLETNMGMGATSAKTLVQSHYQLPTLNKRYQQFIKKFTINQNPTKTALEYWHVLRDAPQLPFE